eukprot:TRINITY_DN2960_c0_g1_i1.p1 TRINITY_DN2960_c0_g1~~TRINITY_DN2960_c0_g1_i1.p1  ORF type:complete len:82 (+),score=3.92 TRINITY_DN2960_c0_g1_i1:379-624(+)
MQQKAWQKILKREEKIFEILSGEFADLLTPEFLGQILTTIKPCANSKSMQLGMSSCEACVRKRAVREMASSYIERAFPNGL